MALTPMLQQYKDLKEQYKDCLLFDRVGDFYEMYFEDALIGSRDMDVVLTKKSCGEEEKAPNNPSGHLPELAAMLFTGSRSLFLPFFCSHCRGIRGFAAVADTSG